jgi:DNA-binding response OmpR family regulator
MQNDKANKDGTRSDKSILVVEDDLETREALVDYLKMVGYSVLEASTERAALHKAAEINYRFFAVMTDLKIPYIDGVRLIQTLMAKEAAIEHYVIFSGYVFEEAERLRSLHKNCHVFEKPSGFEKILALFG